MKHWRCLILSLLLALAACSESETPCAALIGGGSYCLQPTTAIAPFEVQQKVEVNFRERRETLIVEMENDATGLRFVGLTPFGHKLLQVNYDNREASATTLPGGYANSRIKPTLIVALLQITLWPADAVRAGLEAPLTLEESAKQRRIVNRGETTLSIDYNGERPSYRHIYLNVPAADLEINIDTLPEIGLAQ